MKVLQHLCWVSSVVTRSQCLMRAAQRLWEWEHSIQSESVHWLENTSFLNCICNYLCYAHRVSLQASLAGQFAPGWPCRVSAQRWRWAPAPISGWDIKDVPRHHSTLTQCSDVRVPECDKKSLLGLSMGWEQLLEAQRMVPRWSCASRCWEQGWLSCGLCLLPCSAPCCSRLCAFLEVVTRLPPSSITSAPSSLLCPGKGHSSCASGALPRGEPIGSGEKQCLQLRAAAGELQHRSAALQLAVTCCCCSRSSRWTSSGSPGFLSRNLRQLSLYSPFGEYTL